jgi:rSAM/selenodomain-associated transferase 2
MQDFRRFSIIIPMLDEASGIVPLLASLREWRDGGAEIIVVDGGSTDGSREAAAPLASLLLTSRRGRARQMNAGAAHAHGDILVFLHADTRLPPSAPESIASAITSGARWGRFDVSIDGHLRGLRLVAWMMNWRSRLTGIATGDQAIFVSRQAFAQVGGFADLPLMEDIVLSRALRRIGWPACLRERVRTSGRRWQQHGLLPTIVKMWRLRWRFFCGAHPADLAREYGYLPDDQQP